MPASKSTIVGGFVLGGLAIGVIAILVFGGAHLFSRSLRVVVYFQESVAGLAIGAPVTLRGVKVGTVQSMKVYVRLPDLTPVIPVYLEIEPGKISWTHGSIGTGDAEFGLAVKSGLRAQLARQSLVTGQLAVNLDFYPDAPETLASGGEGPPEIPAIPSDIEKLKNQIADLNLPLLAEKARVTLDGIQQVIGELNGNVAPLTGSLLRTSDAARAALEAAAAAAGQLQLDASQTLKSIERLSGATEKQVAATGKDIERILASAGRVTARAEKVIASLDDLTAARAPLRGDLEAAVRDLAASASSLRSLTRELERNPGATLLGRPSK